MPHGFNTKGHWFPYNNGVSCDLSTSGFRSTNWSKKKYLSSSTGNRLTDQAGMKPTTQTSFQASYRDVICMSSLNRSCGALSLSSICSSFFLPPRQRRLWAACSRRNTLPQNPKQLEFSWPLIRIHQRSVFVWVTVCLCVFVFGLRIW